MSVPTIGPPTTSVADGYATDGDGDRLANVWDPADAIAGAARLLRASGAQGDYRRALFAYNPDAAYANAVLAQASKYRAAFAPGASVRVRAALDWAVSHVGHFTYNLGPPTDRGGSVQDMQEREPAGATCDCSMFARWAFAQAGLDIGSTTSVQWSASGRLPPGQTAEETVPVTRGVGPDPPRRGYEPGDLIFFGVEDGANGHVALWLGKGMIVQCSASGNGSNIRPLAGYVAPTGWVRWNLG